TRWPRSPATRPSTAGSSTTRPARPRTGTTAPPARWATRSRSGTAAPASSTTSTRTASSISGPARRARSSSAASTPPSFPPRPTAPDYPAMPKTHAILTGTGTPGATLEVKKTFTTDSSQICTVAQGFVTVQGNGTPVDCAAPGAVFGQTHTPDQLDYKTVVK